MKLFRLLTTTAITTMAVAALAVSASAMTASYEDGVVTLSGIETTSGVTNPQLTLLILNENTTSVAEENIVQIDQDSSIENVTVGTPETNTKIVEGATYYVRVGGDVALPSGSEACFLSCEFTVPTTVVEPELPLIGDIDNDQDWTVFDALEMLNFEAGDISMFDDYEYEDAIKIGDIDADDDITVFDALEVLNFEAGDPSLLDDLIG